jgi:hypothetical protein
VPAARGSAQLLERRAVGAGRRAFPEHGHPAPSATATRGRPGVCVVMRDLLDLARSEPDVSGGRFRPTRPP